MSRVSVMPCSRGFANAVPQKKQESNVRLESTLEIKVKGKTVFWYCVYVIDLLVILDRARRTETQGHCKAFG